MKEREEHWENIYQTKSPKDVSWTQKKPETSLELIRESGLPKNARIIDVGGGDSKLVDFLLKEKYTNITVLDISGKALGKAKERLGKQAKKVQWIETDITQFKPDQTYDLWHDRAAFHFLTKHEQISKYKKLVSKFVNQYLVVGTFSVFGPEKCSGLNVKQYDKPTLNDIFASNFEVVTGKYINHQTPFNTTQNFLFCSFKKK